MKQLQLFAIALGFLSIQTACQSEKKNTVNTGLTDSSAISSSNSIASFKYDSVKVYSTPPVSPDKKVTDTSKAVISYPVFADESANNFVLGKIMETADEGKKYNSYKAYADDFIKAFDDFRKSEKDYPQTWFLDINTEVIRQSENYLGLQIAYVNYSGGAHPNSIYTYLNYTPKTAKEISLDSLILPGSMDKLTAIAEQIFRKNEELSTTASLKDGYFFENDKFKLNNNFTITDKGLKFLYNPYEIKAYVYGTTELLIPFSELKTIAKPNSLISK
ncbi:DUF3298 and DUF4163 domain-containing protein [Pedobacter frigoris]|uniref:DUF3298 and DUF4163 domain-containing protein n=1 Tax=Pedobacter frigoris TaxID=2571272 RepID=A0A4U1CH82_9SPHI|nr:DUF3298 and DUF4163 domain-containing protein [Pedobacter frigoris]TKC06124.1 DUF3298 and DUF4163 domain-containing protein [Pedobacter frigoris]